MERDMNPHTILVAGIDGVMDKVCYQAAALRHKGIETVFYSDDRIGFSQSISTKWGFRFVGAPKNPARDVATFISLLRALKPAHVELYLGAKPWSVASYVFFSQVMGFPLLTWCRGELYDWDSYNSLRKQVNRQALKRSSAVILKELYMERVIRDRNIISGGNLFFLHNRVPVYPELSQRKEKQNILFLNSFKPWRRVELVLEAAAIVRRTYPDVKFKLVGATKPFKTYSPTPASYEDRLIELAHELDLAGVVDIEPFTEDGLSYYERAAIFVLPADVVFCNFSLLEAMERGAVPIVADVEGARRIIDDGIDGFAVAQNAEEIASRIIHLLENPAEQLRMGQAARLKILEEFDIRLSAEYLISSVYPQLWGNAR
jgi:glycosyltransferase involved in cell wall biosynthesis